MMSMSHATSQRNMGTLHFISGRLAAGKTTLARTLADEHNAILISEDFWLSKLSDGISSFEDYLKWSRRCRSVIGPLVIDALRTGTSVVLDFAGNTPNERKWVRSLIDAAEAGHTLHFLDVSEETCLQRLMQRNHTKPEGLYYATTSEEDFRMICSYFTPPAEDEGFTIKTYPEA
jgi:predicted kinase